MNDSASEISFSTYSLDDIKQEPSFQFDNVSEVSYATTIAESEYVRNNQLNGNAEFNVDPQYVYDANLNTIEQKFVPEQPKKEEKPIVHRKTGTISVENYLRRKNLKRNSLQNDDLSNQRGSGEIIALDIDPVMPRNDSPTHADNEMEIFDDNNDQNGNIAQQINQLFAAGLQGLIVAKATNRNNVYCGVCRQYYASQNTFRKHVKTQKHLDNEEMQK